ncbi:MAG TPA: hypothetical protein VEW46_04400 [Pyrinomonadaceae bacterium]|nr:hypothetical protein [Pyrinomonadaceae bacterium]
MEVDLNKRYQTLLVLWFALLMSIVLYFVVALLAVSDPEPHAAMAVRSNSLLTFALAALGTFVVVISFAVKRKLIERSVENQDVTLVQKALVIACAMCEVTALIGLLERFIIRNSDYYLLFIVAAIGTALHFPSRGQLEAATFKSYGKSVGGGPTL